MAATCIKAFMSSIPPSFCYKKGADAGKIPTQCPPGYFRSAALCYENCRSNSHFVLGVCWDYCRSGYTNTGATCLENCRGGYRDMGLTCFHWDWFNSSSYWKNTYWKHSYIPHSITNFSDRVGCSDGMYKWGALCYRDCNNIGMNNCGIGACAMSGAACAQGIISMIIDVGMGVAQFVGFVASFGASSGAQGGVAGAKDAIKQGMQKGKAELMKGLDFVKRIANNPEIRKKFMQQMMKKALEKIKEKAIEKTIETVCEKVGEGIFDKVKMSIDIHLNLEALDPTGIASAVSSCKTTGDTNSNIACAKDIMGVVSNIDPTGLVSIAAALMQPICDV